MSNRLTNTRISTAARTIYPNIHLQSRSNEKENMIMNAKCHAIAAWDFSRWFAVLSPLIGILLGFVGAFFVLH
jgi:hypothetical protein